MDENGCRGLERLAGGQRHELTGGKAMDYQTLIMALLLRRIMPANGDEQNAGGETPGPSDSRYGTAVFDTAVFQ